MDIALLWPLRSTGAFLTTLLVLTISVVLFLKWLRSNTRGKFELEGRHVLITGGSSGIGLATAVEAVRRGARVTIVARDEQRLQAAAQQIRLHGRKQLERGLPFRRSESDADDFKSNGDASGLSTVSVTGTGSILKSCVKAISADITGSFDDVTKAVSLAEDNNGPIDLLINCAGVSIPKRFDDLTIDDFRRMMNVNYFGAVMVTKLIVPTMKKKLEGHIVFVSSMAGQVGLYGFSGYSPSKFALRGLAEALYMELKPYNIGITISYPPDTDTPGFTAENAFKPEETLLMSEAAGLYKPEHVACRLLDDVAKNNFNSYMGLDGFMLTILTAGMGPLSSVRDGICEILFTGIFRFVSLFYRNSFDSIVARSAAKRKAVQLDSPTIPPGNSSSSTLPKERRKSVTFKDAN